MNIYIESFTKKMDLHFNGVAISKMIFIIDGENDEMLDNVVFLEKSDHSVVGFFTNSMNPYLSSNRIHEIDDFNLFASFDFLIEKNEECSIPIDNVKLIFSSQYNELLGIYFSANDSLNSLLLMFVQDGIEIVKNCMNVDVRSIVNKYYSDECYLVCEKQQGQEWVILG